MAAHSCDVNRMSVKTQGTRARTRPVGRKIALRSYNQVATSIEKKSSPASTTDPLLVRTARGEKVERVPVWMMRQAGRYMKCYRDLVEKHPSFRERSENTDLSVEISLQPWKAFRPDGVILFSDILTPLTGMNVEFDIVKGKGPLIYDPIRDAEALKRMTPLDPVEAMPYVGETLNILRNEVGNDAAVLGFVGAPFTLASYVIEGGTSRTYSHVKGMAFSNPSLLHSMLQKLTDNIIKYVQYQADNGAQAVQLFDSWAGKLSPVDFDIFSRPYLEQIIQAVKKTHPSLPIILYISDSGGLIERMGETGADIISLDSCVDMTDALARLPKDTIVQGNMDPGSLFGSKEFISEKILDTMKKAGGQRHIMNLGHGVMVGTPEENVEHWFHVAKTAKIV